MENKEMLELEAEVPKGLALHFHQQEAEHGQEVALITLDGVGA